jgi:phenylacetate-CoA ligase
MIESVFGKQVYDHYGSRDVGMIASQCSAHDLIHFHPWGCHVEFDPIGPTPDGPAYRLLVTDLLNYGQPFIRYDTGDCVTFAQRPCSCGRWFPSVRKVLGRVTDGIFLADGGIVPGTTISTKMGALNGKFLAIAQVQFVQKTHQHLHLRYATIPGVTSAQQELESISAGINEIAGQRLSWSFEQVAEIPRERSGKIRLCVSEIPPPDSILANTLLTRQQSEPEAQKQPELAS